MEEIEKNDALRRALAKNPVIVLIGQSGCGKATQAQILIAIYKKLFPDSPIYYSETGDLFRMSIPLLSGFNKQRLSEIQTAGELQSGTIASTFSLFNFLFNYHGGPAIIDGSPRSIEEAEAFVSFFRQYAKKEIIIIHVHISDEEADRRLVLRNEALIAEGKAPRSDTDTPEKRQRKISYFHRDVVPALGYLYVEKNLLVHQIDGMTSRDCVTEAIVATLTMHYSQTSITV